jgi:hypothetical protein
MRSNTMKHKYHWKFQDGVTLIGQVTLIFTNSPTRYVSINYEGVVWWQSKKQATIAFSSMEVEYIIVAHATKEVWLWKVISDIDFHATTLLYSFATINLLIEKGENNEIKLVYCSIDEMLIGEN